jgi:hypothetical protein
LKIFSTIKFKRRKKVSTIYVDAVIYIRNAVGYILQREVFRLKHDRAAGVF